jgi:hypothetical protein
MKLRKILIEIFMESELSTKLADFGLNMSDLDENGYITLFHGGKKLPTTLNADQIFFLTPNEDEATDYAKMRGGKVFKVKVKATDVNWNTGSREVEIDSGGTIKNGVFIPNTTNLQKNDNLASFNDPWVGKKTRLIDSYKSFKVGQRLKKSKFTIKNIYQNKNGLVQFESTDGQFYNADSIISFETN